MSPGLSCRQFLALAVLVVVSTSTSTWLASSWLALRPLPPLPSAALGDAAEGGYAGRLEPLAQRLAAAAASLEGGDSGRRQEQAALLEELRRLRGQLARGAAAAAPPAPRPQAATVDRTPETGGALAALAQTDLLDKIQAELKEPRVSAKGSIDVSAKRLKRILGHLDALRGGLTAAAAAYAPPAQAETDCPKVVISTEENATFKARFRRLSAAERCALNCRLRAAAPLGAAAAVATARLRFGTCAVVSSSGLMRKHTFGSDIDGSDAVMRFNKAPVFFEDTDRSRFTVNRSAAKREVEEYAAMVGTKETVRIVNGKGVAWGLGNLKLGKLSKDFLFLTDGVDSLGGSVVPLPAINQNLKRVLVSAFPSASNSTFARSDRTLTTGFVGIAFMLHICAKVVLYEMVPSTLSDKTASWHYWERGGFATSNPWHNSIPYETAFWRALGLEDSAHTGRVELEGFQSESSCGSVEGEAPGPWAEWGYTTKGHEVNPEPGMWVPPPGG